MFPNLTLPCRKIDQGHPRVIILSNYDGLRSSMLHTKFRIGPPVLEKKIFEWTTDDGRTPDHGHPISSPCEPSAQVS